MHHFDYNRLAAQRRKLIPYKEVEKFMDFKQDDVLIDVGAGDGFYTCNFAALVPGGRVIALERDESGAALIRKRISEEKLENVLVQVTDVCERFIEDGYGYNRAFFSNTFHDIPCREELLTQLHDSGKRPLELDMIEFRTDRLDMGPPLDIRISEDNLKEIMSRHGFRFIRGILFSHNYMHKYVKD